MKGFFAIICLIGAAIIAGLLLWRFWRYRRAAYQQEREELDKRLTRQIVEGMDEQTRRDYLKSHGQDVV